MRVSFCKLDKRTGQVAWKCRRDIGIVDDQLYHTPSIAATPVLVGDDIVVRETGSRGNTGWSRHFVFIDKESGQEKRKVEACHIDYRTGYAPFAADQERIVYPHGTHDIERSPAVASALDTIMCKDYATGEVLWSYFVGPMFGEPVLAGDSVLVGTLHGDVFCLKAAGPWTRQRRARTRWYFKCDGAVNTPPLVEGQTVFFGSNDGHVYALDRDSGELKWSWHPGRTESRAFRLFSVPIVRDGRLYVGSADGYVYCLDAESGQLAWEFEIGEWVRSAPAFSGDTLVVAALDGTLYGLTDKGTQAGQLWSRKVSTHYILSDLVESEGAIYVATADLYLYCVDSEGQVRWKHSLIESVELDGVRILTDQIAGGGYFTGKPTAVGDHAYVGSPSGFVHAIHETTGKEVWRFECGAAVSAAPTFYNGRIYFGQQGGEDWYYCLDAKTGELVWKQSIGWDWGSANAAHNRIFVPGIDGFANCLDADTGAILWRYRTSRSTCSEPIIDGDTVYFGGWDHYFYAFDLVSGRLLWKFHVDGACDSGTAVAKDGRVYLPSGDSDCFRCLDGKTGEIIWEFCRPKTNFNATLSFDGEHVYISINQGTGLCGIWVTSTICCLDAKTGELVWEHEGGGIPGSVVAGDSVYFASSESPFLYCVARRPGPDGKAQLRWKFNLTDRMMESTPAINHGKAFALSASMYLYAIV
jgi:outer membrane protein assembly factor BamB